jgi:hypothetical protein
LTLLRARGFNPHPVHFFILEIRHCLGIIFE